MIFGRKSEEPVNLLHELDSARCQNKWKDVVSLANLIIKNDSKHLCIAYVSLAEEKLYKNFKQIDYLSINSEINSRDIADAFIILADAYSVNDPLPEETYQREVIADYIRLLEGKYKLIVDSDSNRYPTISKPIYEYTNVSFVQKALIFGMAFESLSRNEEALKNYLSISLSSSVPITKALASWVENDYYRAIQIAISHSKDKDVTLSIMRRYLKFTEDFPFDWRYSRRISALNSYFLFISTLIQNDPNNWSLSDESKRVGSYLEKIVFNTSSFPYANQNNLIASVYIDTIVEAWKNRGSPYKEARDLSMSLYKSASITFLSVKILRHLVTVLLVLEEYEEVEKALTSYIQLVKKDRDLQSKGSSSPSEMDSISQILETLCEGVRLYVKFLQNYDKAKEIADTIELFIKESSADASVLARAWRSLGDGYAFYSRKDIAYKQFNDLRIRAESYYQKSIELDSKNLETLYQYAFLKAESRDPKKGIELIKIALNEYPHHYASWYLLILLLSAIQEYEVALDTCSQVFASIEGELDSLSLEEKDALVGIRLAESSLIEALYNPKEAIDCFGDTIFPFIAELFPDLESLTQSKAIVKPTKERATKQRRHVKLSSIKIPIPLKGKTIPASRKLMQMSHLRKSDNSSGSSNNKPNVSSSTDVSTVDNSGGQLITSSDKQKQIQVHSGSKEKQGNNIDEELNKLETREKEHSTRILRTVWLAAAGVYRRASFFEFATQAVSEAEKLGGHNADSYTELGYIFAYDNPQRALGRFENALILDVDYIPAILGLCTLLLQFEHLPSKEQSRGSLQSLEPSEGDAARGRVLGLMESATRLVGWESSDAWWILGRVYEELEMTDKALGAFRNCIDIEAFRPVRPWETAHPRFL